MFSNYDSWKLATPEEEFEWMYGYDPILRAEQEDEWLWLDSLEHPQPVDEDDFEEWIGEEV
jgi:hypothetical protein